MRQYRSDIAFTSAVAGRAGAGVAEVDDVMKVTEQARCCESHIRSLHPLPVLREREG